MTGSSGSMTSPLPEMHQQRVAAGGEQQRLEAAQDAVGAPVLGQLDGGARRLPLCCSSLLLELVEQREGVGGGAGEAGQHLAAVQAAHLAAPRFITVWPRRHLAVAGHHRPCRAWRSARMVVLRNSASRRTRSPYELIGVGSRHARGCALSYDRHQLIEVDVRVLLRRRQAGVAEQLLDGAQVGAGAEQVGGEAVAQRVRADLAGDAAGQRVGVDEARHRAHRQPAAAPVQEHRAGRRAAARAQLGDGARDRRRAPPAPSRRSARCAPCRPCRARAPRRARRRCRSQSSPTSSLTRRPQE